MVNAVRANYPLTLSNARAYTGNIFMKWMGKKLDQVKEEKGLGVQIDNELKFHKQTAEALKRANSVLEIIKKSFALLDVSTLPLLYKSLVRPHWEYANVE